MTEPTQEPPPLNPPVAGQEPLDEPARRKAYRVTYIAQCAGVPGMLIFTNGMVLVFLKTLGVPDQKIMLLLGLGEVIRSLLIVPFAYWSDKVGIKRIGTVGQVISVVGLVVLAGAGWLREETAFQAALLGTMLYYLGFGMFSAGWFGLLSGFVPPEARGRFFGGLRFSWQTTAILFALGSALVLGKDAPPWIYQVLILVVVAGSITRVYFYGKIPERITLDKSSEGLIASVLKVIRVPHFMPFCAYTFLLLLFTQSAQALMALVEKNTMALGDNQIVMLGGLTMMGMLLGYLGAGFVIDRTGPRIIFLLAHLGYGAVLLLFPARGLFGETSILFLAVMHIGYGVVYACASVAMTAELFGLIPAFKRSLSTGFHLTLYGLGASISMLIPAGCVALGFLKEEWTLFGAQVGPYDAIMLAFGVLTLLMAVSLGLVPSVIHGKGHHAPLIRP